MPRIHKILRNGRVYDRLDADTHAVQQIASSYANDMVGDTLSVLDENDEPYYEKTVLIKCCTCGGVKNPPNYTGSENHRCQCET